MIELDSVTVAYDDVVAVENVDLRADEGEFVTVVGPSGCGKTTLLRTLGGLTTPTSGRVRIAGRPPSVAQSHGDLGFVFQQHTLLPWKTAFQNVTFLRELAGKPPAPDQARELLRTVGLDGFEAAYPHTLSGGMKQRVAIARALHLDASVLLMDEPFGELDEITREELGVEIRRIWREHEKTVLFVTHSVPEAVFLADRCVVVRGTPGHIEAVFDVDVPRPRTAAAFETEQFQRQVSAVRRTLHDDA